MIRDFLCFLRHLFRVISFIRGVILMLVLLLLVCVVVIVVTEHMPFGQATYFVLITALTIGYGDVAPVTAWGKVMSVAAGIIGLLTTGLIIAIATYALRESIQDKLKKQNVRE